MNALNDSAKSDLMSSYKSRNLSTTAALEELSAAQNYDYSRGTAEGNRDNDNRIRALSSYLASTKEGQKALDEAMSTGKYNEKDASGTITHTVDMGNSSKRAQAVLGRNMIDNHSNLRDKHQVAFEQFDGMRGGNKRIEEMTDETSGQALDGQTLNSKFRSSLENVVDRIDLDDENNLGKQDFKKFYKVDKDSGDISATFTADSDRARFTKLQNLADARIKQLKSDTTLISGVSDEEKQYLSLYSTGKVDVNTISNVLYTKDARGRVTGTIEQQ